MLCALAAADDEDGVGEDAGDDEERSRRVMGLKSGTGSARWETSFQAPPEFSLAAAAAVYYLLLYYFYYCHWYTSVSSHGCNLEIPPSKHVFHLE